MPENDLGSSPRSPLWSIPPTGTLRLIQLKPSPPATQMRMLPCNTPDVTGYSCFWMCGIMYMHAHILGEDLAFYQGCDDGIWVHFPLQKGEIISDIWKYREARRAPALIVSIYLAKLFLRLHKKMR